jgi:hypothetical protein
MLKPRLLLGRMETSWECLLGRDVFIVYDVLVLS